MKLDPGQIIDRRFAITTRLGGNQYSSTAKAETVGEGKEVVLKLLSRDGDLDLQKQLIEAKIIQTFSQRCPELLTIEEVGVDNGNVFQLLPFLPLRSLKRHRPPTTGNEKHGAANYQQSYFSDDFQWLVRVANALEFLSQQGRVHGDVKPTNILFSEDDRGKKTAWLSDVEIDSLGELSDDRKVKDEYPGTLQYVSQEVFMDRNNTSAKSDQYALAVTLYQWLAGQLPYKGTTGIEMYKAFQAGCQSISEHCPGLPPTAAAAIHRALAVEPDDRFDSATEFVDAFMVEIPSRSFFSGAIPWKQLAGWVPVVTAIALAGFFFAKAAQNRLSGNDTKTQNEEVVAKTPDPQSNINKPSQQTPKLIVDNKSGKGTPVVQQEQLTPHNQNQKNAIENQLPELELAGDDRKQVLLGSQDELEKRSHYDAKIVAEQSRVEALLQKARQHRVAADNEQSRLNQGDPNACPIKLQDYEDNEFALYEKAAEQGSAEAQKWLGQHYEDKAEELFFQNNRDPEIQNYVKASFFFYLPNHRDEAERIKAKWKLSRRVLNSWKVEYQQIQLQREQQKRPNNSPQPKARSTQPPKRRWNQQPPQQNYPRQDSQQKRY